MLADKRSGNGEAERAGDEGQADELFAGERIKASLVQMEIRRAVEAARREKPIPEKQAEKVEEK